MSKNQKEKNGFVYRIVDWKRRYEITTKQTKAADETPAESLRKKPHEFIRWKVFGHNLGPGYRKIVKKARRPGTLFELAAIGLFGKLLEIAGDQGDPAFRGWILDHDQKPMSAETIAELLDVDEVKLFKESIDILLDAGWVETTTGRQFRKESETVRKIPTTVPNESERLSKSKQSQNKEKIKQKPSENPQITNSQSFACMALSAFGESTQSEKTTFRRLGAKLTAYQEGDPYVFDKAIAQIDRSKKANKPKAYFTTLCNEIIKSKQ